MGVHKGQNNFRESQHKKVEIGKKQIEKALLKIKKGMIFKNLNSLLMYLSAETDFHRTTIKRNSEYFQLALDFFTSQPGASKFINEDSMTTSIAKVKDLASTARIKNLEAENNRLKLALKNSQSNIVHKDTLIDQEQTAVLVQKNSIQAMNLQFSQTSMALLLLIKRLEEKELGIHLDFKNNKIIDSIEINERKVIAGEDKCHFFFEWLEANPYLKSLMNLPIENP